MPNPLKRLILKGFQALRYSLLISASLPRSQFGTQRSRVRITSLRLVVKIPETLITGFRYFFIPAGNKPGLLQFFYSIGQSEKLSYKTNRILPFHISVTDKIPSFFAMRLLCLFPFPVQYSGYGRRYAQSL